MAEGPRQNPSEPVGEGDARLDSAAFHRNHAPIWKVLSPWLCDKTGKVLEVGSGTGQHVIEFARQSPQLRWWPSDLEPRNLASIDAWRSRENSATAAAGRSGVRPDKTHFLR